MSGAAALFDMNGERVEAAYLEVLSNTLAELDPSYDGPPPPRVRATGGKLSCGWMDDISKAGSFDFEDDGTVDWGRVWLRPVYRAREPYGQWVEFPLGIYLPGTPTGDRTERGSARTVEVYDATQALIQDEVAETFVVEAGELVTDVVYDLIESVGLPTPDIPKTEDRVRILTSWVPATSKLRIAQDLLNSINYTRINMGWNGRLYSVKDRDDRFFETKAVFKEHGPQKYDNVFKEELDLFAIPNRWIGRSRSDAETPMLVSVAENTDPESPTSYQARGRWVTRSTVDMESTSQAMMDSIIKRNLSAATNALHEIKATHPIYPLDLRDLAEFHNDRHALHVRTKITHMDLDFNAPKMSCNTTFREVSKL